MLTIITHQCHLSTTNHSPNSFSSRNHLSEKLSEWLIFSERVPRDYYFPQQPHTKKGSSSGSQSWWCH